MAKQGKCIECKVRWTWEKELSLKLAKCPNCKTALKQTSHISSYDVEEARVLTTYPSVGKNHYELKKATKSCKNCGKDT